MKIHYNPFRPITKEVFDYERKVEASGNRVPISMSNSSLILKAILVDLGLLLSVFFIGMQMLLVFALSLVATIWMGTEYSRTLKTWYPSLNPELKKGYWHIYWKHSIIYYCILLGALIVLVIIAFGLQKLIF